MLAFCAARRSNPRRAVPTRLARRPKSFLGLEIGDGDLLKSCQPVPFSAIHGERLMNAMPEERPRSRKTELALVIANGTSVTAWRTAIRCPSGRPAGDPESPRSGTGVGVGPELCSAT